MKFVYKRLSLIVDTLQYLKETLKKGKIKQAQDAYIKAHSHYERIRPIMALFINIEPIINGHASYFINREKDHRFTGFHAIEYQLFNRLDTKTALEETSQLLNIAKDLKRRVLIEKIHINQLIQASIDFIEMIIETKLAGEENIYSSSDLADIAANLEGSEKIVKTIETFISTDTLQILRQSYRRINNIISMYRQKNERYKPYYQLKRAHKMALYSKLMELAERLSLLRAQLNINIYHNYSGSHHAFKKY